MLMPRCHVAATPPIDAALMLIFFAAARCRC